MRRHRGRIARFLLLLYPAAWRARYGEELMTLIEESGTRGTDLLDVARAGIRLRLAATLPTDGGLPMLLRSAHRHPTAFALAGLLVMLPTLLLAGLSLLGHELGVGPIAQRVDPMIAALTESRAVDVALVLAPALALLVAVAPLVRVGVARDEGAPVATVAVRLRAMNVAVALAAVAIGLVLVWHAAVELSGPPAV
ncbi:MAG TPA: hypothetical protein VHK06_05500 [Candidatus Limnocylindria bacterium]|nr:hypothetical protein [Candidatus Limnocylindria bacterium]